MHEEKKICKNITISPRQMSFFISFITGIICIVFIGGYFIGKKQCNTEQHALIISTVDNTTITKSLDAKHNETNFTNEKNFTKELTSSMVENKNQKQFYAKLTSFSTKKHADKFVKKLAKQDIKVHIKEQKSSSSNTIISTWYQVVTAPYKNKEELEKIVAYLTKKERLQGVTIEIYT